MRKFIVFPCEWAAHTKLEFKQYIGDALAMAEINLETLNAVNQCQISEMAKAGGELDMIASQNRYSQNMEDAECLKISVPHGLFQTTS